MNGKIKVVHILWSGGIGGAEEYVTSFISYFNPSEYKTHVCFLSRKGSIFEEVMKGNKNIAFIGMRDGFDIIGAVRLFTYLYKERFDIIHSHSTNILSGLVISLFNKPKKFFTEHVNPGARFFFRKRKLFYKLFSNSFQIVIAISEFVKHKLVEDMHADSLKIVVIHNGVRIDKYNNTLPPPKDLLHIKRNNKYVVGYIGRMENFKRPDLFIDVAKQILRKEKRFQFIMVGGGPKLTRCKKMIYEYGIDDNFEILGFRRDIPNVLKLFDALFFPSSSEGFGIVVLEAMAMGVPVFAINDGAIPEIIVHRENGVLLDTKEPKSMAQQIITCLEDKKLIKKIGKKSRIDVRSKFSVDLCVKKMESLYTRVLTNKR